MRSMIWLLIILGVLCFMVGGLTAFMGLTFKLHPVGFWRGATGFWILAIVLKMMEEKSA